MKKKMVIIALLMVAILVCAIYYVYFWDKVSLCIQTRSGEECFHVEQALTPEQQQKGLMDRKMLAPKTGMLFLFKPMRVARMWMKNTLIPLDMVFFDWQGRVVHVHHNALPRDLTIISSRFPVAGVLEINAGEAHKYGIANGAFIDLKSIK